mgnify:CR=1 FL=1
MKSKSLGHTPEKLLAFELLAMLREAAHAIDEETRDQDEENPVIAAHRKTLGRIWKAIDRAEGRA